MRWTTLHDEVFVREMLSMDNPVWESDEGTTERSKRWEILAESLNSKEPPIVFRVDQRAVREHCKMLMKKYKSKQAAELRSSGTVDEETEIDLAMKEITPLMEECNVKKRLEKDEKTKKDDEDIVKAQRMREKSMNTFAAYMDEETPRKKKRSSGNDAIAYLREKIDTEKPLRR